MNFEERMHSFRQLGQKLIATDTTALNALYERAGNRNPWFTPESIHTALTGVCKLLREEELHNWMASYRWNDRTPPKTIALILAGNIPLVGFHDILTVLITGNRALIKPSSKDQVLIDFVIRLLIEIEPRFREFISFAEILKNFDAVIATGSDNSSRFFQHYFGKYPSIIRKNRTSCAILTGSESVEESTALGRDIFTYYGLGCRNVSKLFVPTGYEFGALVKSWNEYRNVIHHHKYLNNYEYQKAILLVNKTPFLDTGYLLLTPNEKPVSPVSVVYYKEYTSESDLSHFIDSGRTKIQCTIGNHPLATVPFGEAQFPGPADYADGVDTVRFLIGLN